eukprot:scaffold657225_cov113-Prasinocladus_malaysianus.AAC.1
MEAKANLCTPCPSAGERRPGFVGTPLPGVEVKVEVIPDSDEDGNGNGNGSSPDGPPIGELRVKAPQLFTEYWGRPDATR